MEYRRHGLLSSDLPVLMEASEYKSVLALFEEKSERKPIEVLRHGAKTRKKQNKGRVQYRNVFHKDQFCRPVIDPDTDFSLSAGISGADKLSIARHLSTSLGFPVYREHILYRHPEYPFLLASPEYVMVATNPVTGEMKTILLDCHTTTYWNREEWESGVPYSHELRCRQAMCVMNVDEAIVVCLYDNNEGGIVSYRIARDYEIEADIIQIVLPMSKPSMCLLFRRLYPLRPHGRRFSKCMVSGIGSFSIRGTSGGFTPGILS